jgi:hypothetical protein
MRIIFSLLLTFAISATAFAQAEQYNVINIVGQIKVKGSGKLLAKGDVISSEDQIVFMAPTAMAAVFSPSKGRFTLKPKPDQKTGGEFYAFVKASIVPQTQTLATRGGGDLGVVPPDADNEICGHDFLILEGTALTLSDKYVVDDGHFFYLKINWNGQDISKKLKAAEGKLLLDAAEILQVDGKKVLAEEMSQFRLNYYDATTKKSTEVCTFTPIFADPDALTEDATIIVTADREAGVPEEKMKSDVYNYLLYSYGAPAHPAFDNWFDSHFH